MIERVLQGLVRKPGRRTGNRVNQRNAQRRGTAQFRLDINIKLLRLIFQIHVAAYQHTRGRPVNLQPVRVHYAADHGEFATDAVKGKTVAENILEIKRNPARQTLQADQTKLFTRRSRIEFQKLTAAGFKLHASA